MITNGGKTQNPAEKKPVSGKGPPDRAYVGTASNDKRSWAKFPEQS